MGDQAAEAAAYFASINAKPRIYPAPTSGSAEFAQFFDHTLLKLDATAEQFDKVCEEAKQYGFKSVCVRPPWVERCVQNLKGSSVVVGCAVGFHEGTYRTAEKVNEAVTAVKSGAGELDMVMNYPLLIQGDDVAVEADIRAVREAAPSPTILKVIIETSALTVPQIVNACKIVKATGADFIKTSTGFSGRGASVPDVQLMRHGMGSDAKVKASGGVRTLADTIKVIEAGADRIGVSGGVAIMEEARSGVRASDGAGGY